MRQQARFVAHMSGFQKHQVAGAKGEALGREATAPLFPFQRARGSQAYEKLLIARKEGLAARDWLISHPAPADFNLYLEDDLVIQVYHIYQGQVKRVRFL